MLRYLGGTCVCFSATVSTLTASSMPIFTKDLTSKRRHRAQVLSAEYPNGIDVIYEAVGGDMFQAAVDAVAVQGRLLIIGMMSQYGEGWPLADHRGLPEKLLKKGATLQGARTCVQHL